MLRAGFWIIDDRIDAAVLVVVHGAFVRVRAGVDGRAWQCIHVIDSVVEIPVKFLDLFQVLLILRRIRPIVNNKCRYRSRVIRVHHISSEVGLGMILLEVEIFAFHGHVCPSHVFPLGLGRLDRCSVSVLELQLCCNVLAKV